MPAEESLQSQQDLEIPENLRLILHAVDVMRKTGMRAPLSLKAHVLKGMELAVTSSLAAADLLLADLPPCPYGNPPAKVQKKFDSSGNMRLECLHSNPQHCWDLDGHKEPC